MRAREKWVPALFFIFLPLIPLWKCVTMGLCIGPFDLIRQMAPWHGQAPNQPWDILQADGVLQFFPWRDLVLSSWAHLQAPYWNPYELAGTPLLANSQSAGFYPLHVLLGILHIPTAIAVVLLAWFHLGWAGFGVYAVSRKLGGSRLTAAIGGASFTLTPFMLSWTALASVITTVSWIPWCLLFVFEAFSGSRFATVKLALCIGMLILAGHLQFAAYGMMAVVIVAAVCAFTSQERGRGAFSVVLGLVLGAALAAPQLFPVLTFSKSSSRQNKPSEDGYSTYSSEAIHPFEFATLTNPFALGNSREQLSDVPGASTYWPPLVKQGANFAESAVTIGPLLFGLMALVPWKDKRLWPVIAVGLIALLICSGTYLDRLLYFYFPGWSATGSPGRSCVLMLMSVAILAGVAGKADKKRLIGAGVLILVGMAFSTALPGFAGESSGRNEMIITAQRNSSQFGNLTAMMEGALLAAAGLSLLFWGKASKYRRWALAAPVVISVATGGLAWITTGTPSLTVSSPPDQARVAYLNEHWPMIAINASSLANTPPNISSLNRIHELAGYDSLLNSDTVLLLNQINGQNSTPPENGNIMFIKPSAKEDELVAAGVSYIGTDSDLRPIPNAKGRVWFPGKATIVSEDLAGITLNVSGPGRLSLRDRNMPGWSVAVDGAPAAIEPGLWRDVNITGEGDHVVKFTYAPPGLSTGLLLAALSLVILIVLAFVAKDRKAVVTPEAIATAA